MKKSLLLSTFSTAAAVCVAACATSITRPPPPPTQSIATDLRTQVELLLGGERLPTEEDFAALGPSALAVLEQIFDNPAELPSRRARAVAAMALVENPGAETKLEQIIAGEVDIDCRSAAALALARRQGERALPALAPLLADPDPRVRGVAASALGMVGTKAARKPLEEQLEKEEDVSVREAIQLSLTKAEP